MRFQDMLDRRSEEIKQPPLLPLGIYSFRIPKPYEESEITGKDGTQYASVVFQLEILAAQEVDPEEIAAFGKVFGYRLRNNYLITLDEEDNFRREQTLAQLGEFLRNIGAMADGMTLAEGLANATGKMGLVEVGMRADRNDPNKFYSEVKRVFAQD